jgi:hypothetical protein
MRDGHAFLKGGDHASVGDEQTGQGRTFLGGEPSGEVRTSVGDGRTVLKRGGCTSVEDKKTGLVLSSVRDEHTERFHLSLKNEQIEAGRKAIESEQTEVGLTSLNGEDRTSVDGQQGDRIFQEEAKTDSLARARKNVAITLLYTLSIHVIAWTGNQTQLVVDAYSSFQLDVNTVLFQVSGVKNRLQMPH